MRVSVPGTVDSLIMDPEVNRKTNDRSAHLRGRMGLPGPKVAQQYRFDVREAKKLTAKIAAMPKTLQKAVMGELAKRTTLDRLQMPRMNGMALSLNAARELNRLSTELGLELKFNAGQPFPMHPVG